MGDCNQEEEKLEGVTVVNDSDVLCGRGGAALRHAGNQTYRKLVSLNKGLYITCLKTEKLKISRSIVAAIREKKGRFLEKDTKTGTWYDIGDKKAIEKTSQALREGQPKLRQQIVEMGGGAAGAASLIESQFGPQAAAAVAGAGLYPTQGQLEAGGGPRSTMVNHGHQQQQQIQDGNGIMRQQMMSLQQGYPNMQPPQQQQRQMSGGLPFDDIQNDLMSRLSLHDDNNGMHQQQGNVQMRQMMANGMMGMSGTMPGGGTRGYGGYSGNGGQMNQLGMANLNDLMADSFHAALRGMNSPPASIQNSLHSTQHTLDMSSMHSLDFMSGLSGHSIGGMTSNHTMGPPSAQMPTMMSSMSRQHQIDERYPQNLGLGPQSMNQQFHGGAQQGSHQLGQPRFNPQNMTQSFQRQVQDSQVPEAPPPQPRQPQQDVGQTMMQPGLQECHPGQAHQVHPGQPMRAYSDSSVPREGHTKLESLPAYNEDPINTLSSQYQQYQGIRSTSGEGITPEAARLQPRGHSGEDQQAKGAQGQSRYEDQQTDNRQSDSGNAKVYDSTTKTQNMAPAVSISTAQTSVLSPEARQKLIDRRSVLAKMKYRKPPSVRDNARISLSAMSTHSSTGDGMPDIHMVESQHSLHSAMSTMTDGASVNKNTSGVSRDAWVETTRVVDHSSRDYPDVYAPGSKQSIMSGLSKISDHSLNDFSIFSGLSNKIGNVSTRSIAAMSEISVIEVAAENEEEDDDDPSIHNEERAPQKQETSS
jgi:hypothetical protein